MPFIKQDNSTGNVLCFKVEGVVTDVDYREHLVPETECILKDYKTLRMLCDIVEFKSSDFQWMNMWEDSKFGFKKSKYMSRFALICKHNALALAFKPFFVGVKFQVFSPSQKELAYEWIFEGSNYVNESGSHLDEKTSADEYRIPFYHTTKFLVTIGIDEAAKSAIGHALNLVRSDGSDEELHLLTVIPSNAKEQERSQLITRLDNAVSEVETTLGPRSEEDRMKLRVSKHFIELMKSQSIADGIVEMATKIGVDYIVMVSVHASQSTIINILHPSVALEVLKDSPCPVLLVQPYQKVLI